MKNKTNKTKVSSKLVKIVDALINLNITGDALFETLKDDIERGLLKDARDRLDFVDKLIEIRGK